LELIDEFGCGRKFMDLFSLFNAMIRIEKFLSTVIEIPNDISHITVDITFMLPDA
jgi:hypothetical protein